MSGTAEVLQEYLVKLGYKVDPADQKKFVDSLGVVGKRVLGIGTAVAGVVAAVEAASAQFAYSMRKVYFDSQLTNTTVKNMQSLQYAGKQFGISAEAMGGALHSMAQALRLNPGLQGVIESFGIKVTGRDISDVMTDYVKALDKMPEFQASQFAGMFGMDPDTYHLMRNHVDEIIAKQKEMKAAQAAIGLDMDKVAAQTKHYADTIDDLKMHFEGLTSTILSKTAPAFDTFSAYLNRSMDANAKAIQKNGLLSTGMSNMYDALPFKYYGQGFDWVKGKLGFKGDGTPTTPAQRSTGVLPIPGAPQRASGAIPGLGGAGGNASAIAALEKQAGLPPGMLWRVYGIESGFGKNPGTSSAGALGPFQFMQDTGSQYGLTTDADRMDFGKSSKAAARYLSRLYSKYGGNVDKALAAYNWGPGKLDKFGMGGLPPETQAYLGKYHAMESGNVTVQNTFNITGSNSKDIADKVAGAQSRTYADAMRNTQTAVR